MTEGDPPDFGLLYPEWLTVTFFLSTLHAVCMRFLKLCYFQPQERCLLLATLSGKDETYLLPV